MELHKKLNKISLNHNDKHLHSIDLYYDLDDIQNIYLHSQDTLSEKGIFKIIERILKIYDFTIYDADHQYEELDVIDNVFNLEYRWIRNNGDGDYEVDNKKVDFESLKTIKHNYFNDVVDFTKNFDKYPIFRLNVSKSKILHTICIDIVASQISKILHTMIKYKMDLISIEETRNEKRKLIDDLNIHQLDIDKLIQLKNFLKSSE